MKHSLVTAPATVAAALSAACASIGVEPAPVAVEVSTVTTALDVEVRSEPAAATPAQGVEAAPTASGSRLELDLWADPDFQRRFRDSYLATTEVEPPVTFEEREVLQEVLALAQEERFEEALARLADERTPQSSAVFDQIAGNLYFQTDRLERAASSYRAATDRFPRFLRAWKNLGLIYTQRGEHALAAEALTRVLELGGGDGLTYGALGAAYLSIENATAAESAFRMATLFEPDQVQWQLGLARALFIQQLFQQAAALCDSLIERDPSRADYWLLQANAYIGLEQPMRAAENFEFVQRLGGATEDSMLLLGDIYTNVELFDRAIASYAQAFEIADEPDASRPLRAGRVMLAREAYGLAKELLTTVEAAFPTGLTDEAERSVLDLRARIAVAEGDDQAEVAALERLVSLDPTDGGALILLAKSAQRAGELERAELLLDRALVLPDHEAEASVAKATLMVQLQRYSEAVPLLRAALAIEDRQAIRDYLEQIERLAGRR